MALIKNPYYKAFLDGYLLEQIPRSELTKVLDGIEHEHRAQARVLVIIAWASGARPNEYLRLTAEMMNKTKEFVEFKMPSSKGSSARVISLPCFLRAVDGGELVPDPFTAEVFNYVRGLFPTQYLFWFFRSKAQRHGVTKTYRTKSGELVSKKFEKDYLDLGSKLRYYFPKWFEQLFPEGIPPYYLRHNRATTLLETAGREATIMNQGWKSELTLKKYTHKTKQMRRQIGEGLMQ